MSLLSRLFGRRGPAETRATLPGWFGGSFGFLGTGAGAEAAPVTPAMAERIATTAACVQAIASGLAGLPPRVYRVTDAGRLEDPAHPVARLIRAPNRHLPWGNLVEFLIGQALLHGNGLLTVERDGAGQPISLTPIPWPAVTVRQLGTGRLVYDVAPGSVAGGTGPTRRYLDDEVFHLRDRTDDGLIGRSRLSRAPDVVQAALGVQSYSSQVWDRAWTPSGILTLPTGTTPEGKRRAEAHFSGRHAGPENAGQVLFVDKDTTYTPISTVPAEAQTLQSRRYSGEEVARLFGVPPAIIGDLTHGTFTNSETAGRWFAQFTLAPWCRKLEAEAARSLFDPSGTHHLELDMSALQRGDDSARWAAHKIAVETGVLDRDEIRDLEGWNPRPAGAARVPPAADSAPAPAMAGEAA